MSLVGELFKVFLGRRSKTVELMLKFMTAITRWSKEVGVAVAEKRIAFEGLLQIRVKDTYDMDRAQRAVL